MLDNEALWQIVEGRPGRPLLMALEAAAALAAIRRHGGTATVATSDVGDIQRLLAATDDAEMRASASSRLL